MKSHRIILIITISLLIVLFSSSASSVVQALPLADPPQPPIIEQPERPIYEPLYFETHRLPGTPQNTLQASALEYTFLYSAATVQNLDDAGGYNYEVYYYDDYNNINLTNYEDANDVYPKLNPGCTQVVFASDRTGNLELFSMTSDGGNLLQLTWDSESDIRPDWSPDGVWMVWESYRDGQAEIYIQTYYADYVTRLTQDEGFDGMPTWSPDGSKIALVSNRTGGYRVYTMNTDGSGLIQLSDQPYSFYPVWSPDSSQIAFSADADGDGWLELWTMNADGSNEQLLYDTTVANADVIANAWAPNQPVIAYTLAEYVYYSGNWYWESANIHGWDYYNNYSIGIYSTSRAWYLDWQSTDIVDPISAIIEPSTSPQPYRFLVQWTGYDDMSGLKQYEVQMRDGAQGTWEDWILQPYYYDTFEWFQGVRGHTYYFRLRAYDVAGNVEAWPADYDIAVAIETSPPVTAIQPLPRYTSTDNIHFRWDGYDPGESGVRYFNIDKWDDIDLTWTTWFSSEAPTGAELYGIPGHTYRLRTWGEDWAGNVEKPPFLGNTLTTFYSWMAAGQVTDHTGTPVVGAEVNASAEAFLVQLNDPDGEYMAYFDQPQDTKTLTFAKNGYAALPPSLFGSNANIAADFVLPPADNMVQDWGFEEAEPSTVWDAGGVYTPSLASSSAHSGEQAAAVGGESAFSAPVGLGIEPLGWYKLATAVTPDHSFHVAEISYLNNYVIVYRQRLNDNTWLPLEVVTEPTFIVDYIAMAVDSHSVVHLLWQEYNAGTMYATRSPDGTWSEPTLVFSGDSAPEDVFVDENDTLHVLLYWNDINYIQKPDGGDWSEPEVVPISDQAFVKMLVTPEGDAHFLGRTSYLYYVKRSADGSWSTLQQLSTRTAHAFTFALDSQGTPHAVWDEGQDEYSENIEIVYARRKADGSWTSPEKIATEILGKYLLVLGVDSQDALHLVWDGSYSMVEGYFDIYYQQKALGGSWTEPVDVSNTISSSYDPSLALAANGDALVTWVDAGDAYPEGIPYYVWVSGGAPGSPGLLAPAQENLFPPQLSYDGKGSIHILWSEGDEASPEYYHKGTSYASQDGESWIAQSLSVPVSMTQPVLSFLYSAEGLSGSGGAGAEVLLNSTGVTTTLLRIDQNSRGWEHAWMDLSTWGGEAVTLTFRINEVQGELRASLKLDEVTIGQAHPDTWVTTDGEVAGLPGELINLLLQYGNRGPVLAEGSVLTLTLPVGLSFVSADPSPSLVDGGQVVWQLGDLVPGEAVGQIALTLEVDEPGAFGSWLSSPLVLSSQTTELELLNNLVEIKTYVGSLVMLPFTAK